MFQHSTTIRRAARLGSCAVAVVIALAPAAPARAEHSATVLGEKVVLPVPPGSCPLSPDHRADRQALSLVQRVNAGRNTVLMMFADCAELERYRGGGAGLDSYGSYLAPASATRPVTVSRAAFTKLVGEQVAHEQAKVEQAQARAKTRVGGTGVDASLRRNVNLGLLYRDGHGAYTGLIQNWQYEGGDVHRVTVVSALTTVRDRVVGVTLTAPHEGRRSVRALVRLQRKNVRRLIAAN